MRYAVVIEKGERNYSAYVLDLPGCVSVGDTAEQVKAEIREAIEFDLEGMREDGLPNPEPSSQADMSRLGSRPPVPVPSKPSWPGLTRPSTP